MKKQSGPGEGSYETRLRVDAKAHAALTELAAIFSVVERKVFTQVLKGSGLTASFKKEVLKSYGIPSRLLNSVRVSLYGRIKSRRESLLLRSSGDGDESGLFVRSAMAFLSSVSLESSFRGASLPWLLAGRGWL